jgi:DNA mismatch repair protein MutL
MGINETMNTIRILPEEVSSQIAAGEVIERPASVVKELIDNSIDAGADRIGIRIERGGKKLIRVNDNGAGMSRDDLLLCVERHATSKIEKAGDLFSVKSLGFRGEALPSIASVSRMQIISRLREELAGYRLKIEGGRLITIEETGTPPGTIVEVGMLFFNMPARRKFLRADKTEADHIIDVLSRAALPFPAISFKLEEGAKTLMNLPASDQFLPRISTLFGRTVAGAMTEAQEKNHGIAIHAYLASPDFARTRGDRMFCFINGRNIRDRLVTRSVIEGYGQRLMKGNYPQVVIFLDINPSEVDVNVHPTKQEVRFHNSRNVFQTIVSFVEKALARPFHVFSFPGSGKEKKIDFDQKDVFPYVQEPVWKYSKAAQDLTGPAKAEGSEESLLRERPQVIGQVGNTYILCQVRDGLLIVDQHAAHERIVYENLKKSIRASQLEIQTLLIPHKIELTMKERRIVLEKGSQLSRFGIDLDHFGGNTFLLRSVPVILGNVRWDSFISELIAGLEHDDLEDDSVIDKVLTLMACHGAIRAGHSMTNQEMVHLLTQLDEMALPANCPHGRPTFRYLTFLDMEKMFKRVV